MGRKKHPLPTIREHRALGQYYVRFSYPDGTYKNVYLGPIGNKSDTRYREEAIKKYDLEIAKFLSNHRKQDSDEIKISALVFRFLDYAKNRFVKHGRSTGSYERYRLVVKPMMELFAEMPIKDFFIGEMVAVRERMLQTYGHWKTDSEGKRVWIPVALSTINHRMGLLKNIFKKGKTWGLVPRENYWDIKDLEPLLPNESIARETDPVRPVSKEDCRTILSVLDRTNPVVADMMRIHLLSGCRSTELCLMRFCDIKRDFPDGIWEYLPAEHKTEHHKKPRIIPLGPRAQKILSPYLNETDEEDYIFSPRKAMALQRQIKRQSAKHPPRKVTRCDSPSRPPREHYTRDTYRNAIRRAAKAGGISGVFPHQFRHFAGTEIDQTIGKEAAQTILGHADLKTTDIYTDYNRPLAHKVAKELG